MNTAMRAKRTIYCYRNTWNSLSEKWAQNTKKVPYLLDSKLILLLKNRIQVSSVSLGSRIYIRGAEYSFKSLKSGTQLAGPGNSAKKSISATGIHSCSQPRRKWEASVLTMHAQCNALGRVGPGLPVHKRQNCPHWWWAAQFCLLQVITSVDK